MFGDKETQRLTSGLAQNQNQNQIIILENLKSFEFFDKKEVAYQCQISVHTLQNWLGFLPPKDYETKKEEKGKKVFREDYLKRLFEKYGNLEDFEKLKKASDLPVDLPLDILKSKNETIETLRNYNKALVNQLAYQQIENQKLLEIIGNSQKLELEKFEAKKKLELQGKKTNQNWLTYLLVFFRVKRTKDPPNDN